MEIFTNIFAIAVGLSALSVVAIQQILKAKIIPATFANKYPVPTNIALSIGAALFVVWRSTTLLPVKLTDWVILVATISVTAALTYNQLLKNWTELRATESPLK